MHGTGSYQHWRDLVAELFFVRQFERRHDQREWPLQHALSCAGIGNRYGHQHDGRFHERERQRDGHVERAGDGDRAGTGVDVNTPSTPSENPHTISPYVYGMNGYVLDSASEKIANPGIVRWGGDDTSRYNYQLNMTNSASDYYFENFSGGGGQFPNATGSTNFHAVCASRQMLPAQRRSGTVPVIGWVANNMQYACSFTQSQFPSQQSFESGCGNGVLTSGVDLNGSNGTTANANSEYHEPFRAAAQYYGHFGDSDFQYSSESRLGDINLGGWNLVWRLGELAGDEFQPWQRRERQRRGRLGSGQRANVVGCGAPRRPSRRIHVRRSDKRRHRHGAGDQDGRSDGAGERAGDRLLGSVLLLEERH